MPATSYKIWDWGKPTGIGVMQSLHVGVAGVAKAAPSDHPCAVANEVICGDLGRALRLPIPPGFIITRESDKVVHHVSMNFALAGQNLPPADPSLIAVTLPSLACGVILFDLWVANNDRHDENLAFDETAKSLQLFDHGHAFMCGTDGRTRLSGVKDEDILKNHCLTPEIVDVDGFDDWNARINAIPEFYVSETVAEAASIGLKSEDVSFCTDYLLERRKHLMDSIHQFKSKFAKVKPDLWRAA